MVYAGTTRESCMRYAGCFLVCRFDPPGFRDLFLRCGTAIYHSISSLPLAGQSAVLCILCYPARKSPTRTQQPSSTIHSLSSTHSLLVSSTLRLSPTPFYGLRSRLMRAPPALLIPAFPAALFIPKLPLHLGHDRRVTRVLADVIADLDCRPPGRAGQLDDDVQGVRFLGRARRAVEVVCWASGSARAYRMPGRTSTQGRERRSGRKGTKTYS